MFCFVLAFLTQSCENQNDIDLATPENINLVETRNDDHPVRPPGSTSTANIPEGCGGLIEKPVCKPICLPRYEACLRKARAAFIESWFEEGCDAWVVDVTPYLTNQMIHIPIMIGEEDIITTIPHPTIPNFNEIYYNASIEGCVEIGSTFSGDFRDACFDCTIDYFDCCDEE